MTYGDTRNAETVERPRAPLPDTRERAVERRGWSIGPPGPGMILGLFGALAVLVSLLLAWRDPSVHADDVPLRFLVDDTTGAHHPSLLLALIPLLVLMILGSLLPRGSALRLVSGIGVLVVVGLFVFQVDNLAGDADVVDVLDAGVYVAAIGGLLALVSGFVPSGWHTRRTVDRYVDVT